MKKSQGYSWKIWAFVVGLNLLGLLGALFLQYKGISLL